MYWSNYGLSEYVEILARARLGILVLSSTGAGWDEAVEAESEKHLLVLAQKW